MSIGSNKNQGLSNLNDLLLYSAGDKLIARRKSFTADNIEVFFDGLQEALIREIKTTDAVFGCVAWLTNEEILKALAGCSTSIILAKENYLRPTSPEKPNTRILYNQLSCAISPWDFEFDKSPARSLLAENLGQSVGRFEAVRCLGSERIEGIVSSARLHHKFIVFCRRNDVFDPDGYYLMRFVKPYAVWTGSFNFTWAATQSLENAVLIKDEAIANAYLDEFFFLYPFTEGIDWDNPSVEDPFWLRWPPFY